MKARTRSVNHSAVSPWPRRLLDGMAQDFRFAIRSLRHAPGFVAVAVVTLALGIGANAAIFSVVRGVLLQALPYAEPDRLVHLSELNYKGRPVKVSGQNFRDWRDQVESLESVAAYTRFPTTVLGGALPTRSQTAVVSSDFFQTLGVVPQLGRVPRPEEHRLGAEPLGVVSRRFWRDQLGGRELDGQRIEVDEFSLRVVGVMPAEFDFPEGTDVWYPKELYPLNPYRSAHNWHVIGRLAPGAEIDKAKTELEGITARLVAGSSEAADYLAGGVHVVSLRDELVGPVRKPLWILLAAAGLVLLVACTNLASGFLARGTDRGQEIAVRGSLGADRGRLLRQLFIESLVVALTGGAAGMALALGVVRALVAFGPEALPRLADVSIDAQVLAFALGLAVLTAVLFGLIPGLRITRDAGEGLRVGSAASHDRGWRRSWRLLVAAEVALALILLVGSGLLVQSLWRVLSVELGFEPESVVTVDLSLPSTHYPEEADIARFHQTLLDELHASAGVAHAGVISDLPLVGGADGQLGVRGAPEPYASAEYRSATGDTFPALGIPVLRGRLFDERDRADTQHVAVVSRSFAERVWPGDDAIGKQINSGGMEGSWGPEDWATVVGVVGDIRAIDLSRDPAPTVYMNALQRPGRTADATLVVRSKGRPEVVAATARSAVRHLDPNVPTEVASMDQVIWESVSRRRFSASLLSAFAGLALVLSVVGIYGVVAYSIGRRRRELGIRMALGAVPSRVRNLVLRESMVPVGVGIVVGTAGALVVTRVLRSLLYEVRPTDPGTFAAVIAVLALAALTASYLPARRTAAIDPVMTMRSE